MWHLLQYTLARNKNEDKLIDSKFQKINYSLKYNYLDSIGKKIVPNENFNYWAYSTYYERYGDGKISQTILKEGGNKILKKSITEKFKPYGIFEGGHPSYRCNYVTIIENQKVKYIRTDEELRNFIGDIDNLEEAILLAHTYGYQLDTELKARLRSYDLADRMQVAAPEAVDLSKETDATKNVA